MTNFILIYFEFILAMLVTVTILSLILYLITNSIKTQSIDSEHLKLKICNFIKIISAISLISIITWVLTYYITHSYSLLPLT